MEAIKPWICVDSTNTKWKFTLNDDNELQYTVMNKEGKWLKEKRIDKDVIGLYIYTFDKSIHIIYSTLNAELKYCTFLDEQWMGKVIYKLDNKYVEIKDIKVIKSGQEIHIFCLLIDNSSNDHGIILHCIWNGTETNIIKQQDIILFLGLNEYYLVYLDENSNIDLLFISDEGNEISINLSSYKNNKWSSAKRLYGILGDEFEFNIVKDQFGIHILNKFRDESSYYLEHVLMKNNGEFLNSTICDSNNELTETILVKIKDKIYSFWLDGNKIYASVLNEFVWSTPFCLKENSKDEIIKCNFCTASEKEYIDREVYVEKSNFNLIFPGKLVIGEEEKLKSDENDVKQEKKEYNHEFILEEDLINNDHNNKYLMAKLSRIQSDNTILMQTIASLNSQSQNQENIQSEFDLIYKRLEDEKAYIEEIIGRLKRFKEEIEFLNNKVDKLTEDNVKLNRALEFGKNFLL
ncbi:hypothetical protein [Sedimentibacter sp.]|uniref:hypothetical protein n=1 Tax=Sedimentibacter sp. TaxID=1960295 RepID=UPI0028B14755|nr:hypothetical protein [Sedimentibacter sp.]